MKGKNLSGVLLLFLLSTMTAMAQMKVTGTIVDDLGEPLMAATVLETGTSNGTVADIDGKFTLTMQSSKNTITISYVGYKTQVLQPKATMEIQMVEDNVLAEMVVTGYQVQRKADLTGAVSVLDMKKPQSESSANVINSMQGRLPGVNIVTDPSPGGQGSSIQIRGMSNFNGNNSPLYIIDGIASDNINSLNPSDIESLQVLKDASSASIYGSRAANGVVIVTTKQGKGGKLSVNVGYTASAQFMAKKHQMLNANEWGTAYYQACMNSGQSPYNPYFTYDSEGHAYLNQYVEGHNGEVGYELHDTNWQDEIYHAAWTHNVNASVSNSSDKGSMLFSANYMSQKGIVKQSSYNRLNVRLNSTFNISKYVSLGENLMIARWDRNVNDSNGDAGVAGNTLRQFAGLPVRQSDGSFSVPRIGANSDIPNPMEDLYNLRDNSHESWRIFGNAYIEIKPVKGLSLKSNIGYDHTQFDNDDLTHTTYINNMAAVSRSYGKGDTWTWTNTANYNHSFAEHTINALLGVEAIGYDYSGFSAMRKEYRSEDYNYMVIDAGTGDKANSGSKAAWGLFSLFGKLDYNYADRYLASFTLRRDASSRLGKHNNSGIFPALSAAWRISNEEFFKDNNVIDDLKLRVAWGQNGNSEIGNYATYTTYGPTNSGSYDMNGTGTSYSSGLGVINNGTENLKWETTTQTNIGLDSRFLNGALGLSADFYVKTTKDMLTRPPVISAMGENATQWRNTGNMRNIGFEATIDYRSPERNGFSWDASLNFAHYKNKIIKLNDQQTSIGDNIRLIKGQPMGVYYGYVCDGIFQTKEQVANHATQQGAAPGRLIFRDINGDGNITDEDRCIIGDPNSDLSLGLNFDVKYKGFTLSMFFTGDFGFDVWNQSKALTDFFGYGNPTNNRGTATLNAWTPTNTSATIPALSMTDENNEARFSTYYIEDGSYFKMKYIKLSYELPSSICKKLTLSNINLFAQLENIFTITNYSGLDPEIATGSYGSRCDNSAYPRSRTFTMGFNVNF